jgi:hypothetical protein
MHHQRRPARVRGRLHALAPSRHVLRAYTPLRVVIVVVLVPAQLANHAPPAKPEERAAA